MKKVNLIALLLSLSGTLFAQQFNLVGSATSQSCACYQITPDAAWNSGAVWNNNLINLTQDFDFNFDVFLGCNDGGADGIAFVLQNTNTGFASNGGGLGYQGFPNQSVAIEIDTYQNSNYGDPAADHVALESNGNVNHNLVAPIQASSSSGNIEDCQWHDFRVVWNASTQTLSTFFDGILRFNYTFPGGIINSIFGGNPGNIYWGFTGATGQFSNQQQFCLNLQASFQSGTNYSVCGLNPVSFNSTSSSGLNSIQSYLWDFGDGSTSTLQNPVYTYASPGVYQVTLTITDQSLCTSAISHTVSVFNQPTATVTASPVCSAAGNGSVLFTVSGGLNPFVTALNGSSLTISNPQPGQWLASGLSAGSYSFILTDQNGCADTLSANILQSASPPAISLQQVNPVYCSGQPDGVIEVSASGGNQPYTFTCNNSSNASGQFSGLPGGSYLLVVSDGSGCRDSLVVMVSDTIPALNLALQAINMPLCHGGNDGSFTLIAQGGTAPYSYSLNQGLPGASSAFSSLSEGTYAVVVSDQHGCSASLSIPLNEPLPLQIQTLQLNPPSCPGGQDGEAVANVTGGTAPYSYNWNGGGAVAVSQIDQLSAGTYSLQVFDNNGCSISQSFNLNDPVFILQTLTDYAFCANADTFIAPLVVGGSLPFTIQWSIGSNTIYAPQLNDFSGIPAGENPVVVSVTDGNGCQAQDSFILELFEVPEVQFNTPNVVVCGSHCSNLSVQNPDSASVYHWNFGDGNTAEGIVANHCYHQAGVYSVSLSAIAGNGCMASTIREDCIRLHNYPNAEIRITSEAPYYQEELLSLYAADTRSTWTYSWNSTALDASSSDYNFTITPYEEGTLCVLLEVTEASVCSRTDTLCLLIEPPVRVFIPNAFTPNGDGLNDLFAPAGISVVSSELIIYDRWGTSIYEIRNPNGLSFWDGGDFPQGSYKYILNIATADAKTKQYIGEVTLLR